MARRLLSATASATRNRLSPTTSHGAGRSRRFIAGRRFRLLFFTETFTHEPRQPALLAISISRHLKNA